MATMAWVAASLVENLLWQGGWGLCHVIEFRRNAYTANLPHKRVALIFEHAYLLNCTERRESLLQNLFGQRTGQGSIDAATVYGAIGGTALVVDFIECQRLCVDYFERNLRRRMRYTIHYDLQHYTQEKLTFRFCCGRFSGCPIGANRPGAKPLAVHCCDRGFSFLQSRTNTRMETEYEIAICRYNIFIHL